MAFTKKPFSEIPTLHELKNIINVARGTSPADLTIYNASVINVFTREIETSSILVKHGRIAAVIDPQTAQNYPTPQTMIDAKGSYVAPSFIDAHVHFESSMLTLTNFAKAIVPHGTGLVVIDPHEITNVLGKPVLEFLSKEIKHVPLDVFMEVPSCVPAAQGLETPANELFAEDIAQILDDPAFDVYALAELMNYPGILFGVDEILQRVLNTVSRGKLVEGHAPGLHGGDLNAYIASGILSDHESVSAQEAREKLRRGMTLQIRNGSVADDLPALIQGLLDMNLQDWSHCVFACDDRHPDDLLDLGHIDYTLQQAISYGLDPLIAIQLATINSARHLHLDRVLGSIAPGKWANMVLFENLESINVKTVFYQGIKIAHDKTLISTISLPPQKIPDSYLQTVHLPAYTLEDIHIQFPSEQIHDNTVKIKIIHAREKSLLTGQLIDTVHVSNNGVFIPDTNRDYLPMLVLDRHHNVKQLGKGVVHGFGLKKGAIASTIAHDTHNLVVIGSDYESMLTAIHQIQKQNGGVTVTQQSRVLASLPLPFGGIISQDPVNKTAHLLKEVRNASAKIGCSFHNPEMTLAFMALPVIPELKLTDKGLVDVIAFQLTTLTT